MNEKQLIKKFCIEQAVSMLLSLGENPTSQKVLETANTLYKFITE